MKIKNTILASLLALSFLSTQAQANPACDNANDNLRATLAMYGVDTNMISNPGSISIPGGLSQEAIMAIGNAQSAVTMACTTWNIGGE
jgi:hypothetical protein